MQLMSSNTIMVTMLTVVANSSSTLTPNDNTIKIVKIMWCPQYLQLDDSGIMYKQYNESLEWLNIFVSTFKMYAHTLNINISL